MATATSALFSFSSVVRGHHILKSVWTPFVGEELNLSREFDNPYDRFAVAVTKGGKTVRRVPREVSRPVWKFIRDGGTVACRITGKRRRGKGLEVPCVYQCAAASNKLIKKLQDSLK